MSSHQSGDVDGSIEHAAYGLAMEKVKEIGPTTNKTPTTFVCDFYEPGCKHGARRVIKVHRFGFTHIKAPKNETPSFAYTQRNKNAIDGRKG